MTPGPAPPDHTYRTGWLPSSPCTSRCLPPQDRGGVGVVVRLCVLATVMLAAAAGALLLPRAARPHVLRRCCRGVLRAAGVTLRVHGDARFTEGGGALVVANHRSWLDIAALHAVQPVRMLAKREVRDWPVIGGVAARTCTLFIDRAGLRGLPTTVAALAGALRGGSCVCVFPEGTTWCGVAAGPFRRAAFQAALDAGAPVRPVAIMLRHRDGRLAPEAAFVGPQTLLDSLRRVLRERGLTCDVTILPLLSPHGDRRELARCAAAAVGTATGVHHPVRRSTQPITQNRHGVGSGRPTSNA